MASIEDVDLILNFMEAFYANDGYPFDVEKSRKNVLKFIDDPALGRLWLMESSGTAFGYLILTFGFSFEYGGRDAFLDEFYLEPEFRSKGIGTEAMRFMFDQAKELDVQAIHLEVERTNAGGQKLYINTGFESNDRVLLTKRIQ